jgi:hypothetical protein
MSLETQLKAHSDQDERNFDRLSEDLKEIRADVKAVSQKVVAISQALEKQKGYVAGFASAFTLLMSMVIGLAVYIWNNLR